MAASAKDRAAEPMLFFPHDANASSDVKCRRLIRRLGFEGYGRWWRLCEEMAASHGHAVAFETDEDLMMLADILGFDSPGAAGDEAADFIGDLIDIGLVSVEGGLIRSKRMDANADYRGKVSESRSKAAKTRWNR